MFKLKSPARVLAAIFLFAAALDAGARVETCFGDPRFEFNMSAAQQKNAIDIAVKSAISKKIGDVRKARYGSNSAVQVISLRSDAADFIITKNKKEAARVHVAVSGVRLVKNDGNVFPRTEKTVKFNLKGVHRSYPGEDVYSDVAYQFIKRNSALFDCRGSHEHGQGSGTRQFCKDVVYTVRKIVEFDADIKITDVGGGK